MRQVRTAALSRQSAPEFARIHGWEMVRLRQLPGWMRWLFVELVGCVNVTTGEGRASWPRLVALMDFDQMPGRPPAGASVSLDQIRRAVRALAAAGLVDLDTVRNERESTLFFRVWPRVDFGVPGGTFARGYATPPDAPIASAGAALAEVIPKDSPGVTPGGSREEIKTARARSEPVDNSAGRAAVQAALDALRGGMTRAPKGAGT